jgi:hypothetical protein
MILQSIQTLRKTSRQQAWQEIEEDNLKACRL